MKLLLFLSFAAFIVCTSPVVNAASETTLNIELKSLDCTVDFLQDGQNIYQYMEPSICTTRVSPPPISAPSSLQPDQNLVERPVHETSNISKLHSDPIAIMSIEQDRSPLLQVKPALKKAAVETLQEIGKALAVMFPLLTAFILFKLMLP